MTRRFAAGLLLALALATGTPGPATADDDCAQQHRRVRVPGGFAEARLSFVGIMADGRSRTGAEFPGSGLRELRIVAAWSELEQTHHQRLEIFSPDGSMYQRFTDSFDAAGRPLSVTSRLLVNGTSVVGAGLYGEWCAELFLDDEDAPIARRPFLLTP